jgi:hypothetical protein
MDRGWGVHAVAERNSMTPTPTLAAPEPTHDRQSDNGPRHTNVLDPSQLEP